MGGLFAGLVKGDRVGGEAVPVVVALACGSGMAGGRPSVVVVLAHLSAVGGGNCCFTGSNSRRLVVGVSFLSLCCCNFSLERIIHLFIFIPRMEG
jgi:hypothetical protein